MYGRQQQQLPPYPRQYGQGNPQQQQQQQQQHQQQYPPQQQQQQPQYGQQYPRQYAPQYGQPPQQQQQQQQYPPQQPANGAQYHDAPQPRGSYGHPAGLQQHALGHVPAAAAPRGPTPYARPVAPPAVSSYESQAQRWKKGFSSAPGASGAGGAGSGGGGASRQSDIEAPLIAELCASAGSSYPPRDALQKLLRHLSSLDHQYVCELLDNKLEDRLWQVQGKALSVLDALFKSQEGETYKTYYYHKSYILEAICGSRKELLKARAEKIVNMVRSHAPPAPASPEYAQEQPREEPSLLLISPVLASAAAPTPVSAPPVNLLGSPMLTPHDEPAAVVGLAPTSASSAFGFLNAHAGTPASASEQPAVSAFSFLSAQQPVAPLSAPSPALPPMTGVASAVTAPPVDIFSSLPPPTPVQGLVIPAPTPVPQLEGQEDEDEEPPVHDPIHDAFEGLNFDDDDQNGDGNGNENGGGNESNPLSGFSTTSRGTMGGSGAFAASTIKIEPSDPIREVNLEVDVPAGPMGLMLDRSIPHMAIVQGFLPMPTGERGYLEMHPVLCPGCALVSINSMSVEDKGLEEVGAILGSLVNSYKVLRFKKLLRSGRTVSPANPDVVYVPPPPEKPEEPPVEEKGEEEENEDQGDGEGAEDGGEFLRRLAEYNHQLDAVEQQMEEIVHRDRAHEPVGDMKNQLAQLHGNVEKIQTQGIDSVILGANPPSNADEIRQMRSALVRRSDALAKRIQKIVMHGTAPSPLVGAAQVAVGSPEVSAFSFVGGAGIGGTSGAGFPQMPSLQLPQPVPSAFSFMQSTASPVNSPVGAASMSGSAFSFLSAATPAPAPVLAPSPAVATTSTVFAGLSLRGNDEETLTAPASVSNSAFSFMPGHATPVGVMEPPHVTSPTFSFLRGATASPPTSPATAGPPGSAFSFIS